MNRNIVYLSKLTYQKAEKISFYGHIEKEI